MTVHRPAPVSEISELSICRWTVRELPDGDRHIVGVALGEGRVSSKIIDYDKTTRTFTTQTGRKYQLCGEGALNINAEYVWDIWCHINHVEESKDVTHEYEKTEEE